MSQHSLYYQQLKHYSDLDSASESGISDISYVLPFKSKKNKQSSNVTSNSVSIKKLGIRARRRYENEAFLHSLAALAETDAEDLDGVPWPESISSNSAFTQLFVDEKLRAVWEAFISLSEAEQDSLLSSLNCTCCTGVDTWTGDWSSNVKHMPYANEREKIQCGTHRCRRPRRGHRKPKVLADTLPRDLPNEEVPTGVPYDNSKLDTSTSQLSLQLPSTLGGAYTRRRTKVKQSLTTVEFCLIARIESELRTYFSRTVDGSGDGSEASRSWTPSISLLRPQLKRPRRAHASKPLLLDNFHRLLVHSTAAYLSLASYSCCVAPHGARQLWVENPNDTFLPPIQSFVSCLGKHVIRQQM